MAEKELTPLEMLVKGLQGLNVLPRTGHGRIEFIVQDWVLLDIVTHTERLRVKEKLTDQKD